MAGYCHGVNAPYGCGHHAEHVEAARKGWITRRRNQGQRGTEFEGSEEQRLTSLFLGDTVSLAHTHPEHKNTVVFKQKGKWYELPKRTFASFVRGGRETEREQQKLTKQRKREQRLELENKLYQERVSNQQSRANEFRAAVIKGIQRQGGIRSTSNRATGRTYDRGEVALLPSSIRRSKGKLTLDSAREFAEELNMAEYGLPISLETPDDFVGFFERDAYRRQQSSARRRILREEIAATRTPRKRRRSA